MNKTFKELYDWDYIQNPETSLLKHVNKILAKTPNELNVDDICLLIRQEMFLDIAVPKAIDLIKKNPSIGDNYHFSLLKNLSCMDSSLLPFKAKLLDLIIFLEHNPRAIIFEEDYEKERFLESLKRLKAKVNK